MSKPLELTIYPIWDDGFGTLYADKGDRTRPTSVGYMQVVKRLTEPELAAEYWHAEMQASRYSDDDCWSADLSDHRDQLGRDADTLYRFATHPHYFEATEPESDTE